MKIVCVATESRGYYPALEAGCAGNGLELVTLGSGREWRGFTWRWALLERYLATLDPEELVVHVDAYDVIAVPGRSAASIERRFRRASRGKDILMSVEAPPPNLLMGYVYHRMFDRCHSTHVNGGCYAGKAGALLRMIAFLRDTYAFGDGDDDQQLFAKMCATPFFEEHCALDVDSRVFCNVWAPETMVQGSVTWDSSTARDTCFVHAPANGDMGPVLDHYGIPSACCTSARRGSLAYTIRGAVTYAKYLWPEYLAVAACVCAIVWWWIVRISYSFLR